MIYQQIQKLRKLAKCWNNFDITFIEDELADDFIYESQWALIPIEGKQNFLTYLQSKFTAIKASMQSMLLTVTAEMAFHPSLNNRPCLVLTQITENGFRQVLVLINIQESKIKRIDICFIPNPEEARLTGDIPR